MADTLSFDAALAEAVSFLSELGMSRVIRPEQKEAIYSLVHGSDLLAVLPTGFGKSLIFQLLIRVKQILSSNAACVIVVCPLKSIVQDQLTEASLRANVPKNQTLFKIWRQQPKNKFCSYSQVR